LTSATLPWAENKSLQLLSVVVAADLERRLVLIQGVLRLAGYAGLVSAENCLAKARRWSAISWLARSLGLRRGKNAQNGWR
jgi:hypothetical protein